MSLCLVFALLPAVSLPASAEDAPHATFVTIKGSSDITLNSTTPYYVSGAAKTKDELGDSVWTAYFDSDNDTLNLNNFQYAYNGTDNQALYANGNLTLNITGENNSITNTGSASSNYAINVAGALTIKGQSQSDKLTATGGTATTNSSSGISAQSLSIENCTVSATGGEGTGGSYGIICAGGSVSGTDYPLKITNSTVTATGGTSTGSSGSSYGIRANSNCPMVIKGSTVTAKGGGTTGSSGSSGSSYGISAGNTFSAEGSTIDATGGTASGTSASSYGINGQEAVTIENCTVTATGGTAATSYGVLALGDTTLTDSNVNATGGTATSSYGISCNAAATLTGGKLIAKGNTRAINGNLSWTAIDGSYDWIRLVGQNLDGNGASLLTGVSSDESGAAYSFTSASTYKYLCSYVAYNLNVGEVSVTSENASNIGNTTNSVKAAYNPGTKTLTLNNYAYSGAGLACTYPSDYSGDYRNYAALNSQHDLNIKLIGSNSISQTIGSGTQLVGESYGIRVSGTLNISGDGILTATGGASNCVTDYNSGVSKSCGINAKILNIESGTVIANGGTANHISTVNGSGESYGIYCSKSNEEGTVFSGSVTIGGSAIVTANGGAAADKSFGIYGDSADFTGGVTVARAGLVGGRYDIDSRCAVSTKNAITLNGAKIAGAVTKGAAFDDTPNYKYDNKTFTGSKDGEAGKVATGIVLVPDSFADTRLSRDSQTGENYTFTDNIAVVTENPTAITLTPAGNNYINISKGKALVAVSLYEGTAASTDTCGISGSASFNGTGKIIAVGGMTTGANSYGISGTAVIKHGSGAAVAGVGSTTQAASATMSVISGRTLLAGGYSDRAATWVSTVSTAPTASVTTVQKTSSTQAMAAFTLTNSPDGTYAVYADETTGTRHATVTAALSGSTLTLTSSAGNIAAGVYYVAVTESNKDESARLALTVNAYVAPSGGGSSTPSYTITNKTDSDQNGSVTVDSSTAKKGTSVTVTPKPNEGYTVSGIIVKDANGNIIPVTKNADGTYSFKMPDGKVTIEATFETKTDSGSGESVFVDVKQTDWFYNDVKSVCDSGLMNGTGNSAFDPQGEATRGMLATVLARNAGVDTDGSGNWYDKGVNWVVDNGVSDGTDPDGLLSREQMVTMLYRYAVKAGADVSVGESTNILSYDDFDQISEYAVSALQWAVGVGIIKGNSASTLNPRGTATRAEFAVIMQRFLNQK